MRRARHVVLLLLGACPVTPGENILEIRLALPDHGPTGSSVTFEHFYVPIADVSVRGTGDGEEAVASGFTLVDLAHPETLADIVLVRAEVPVGQYDENSFRIGRAAEARAGNVDADAVAFMIDNRYSTYVSGEALSNGQIKRFRWGFSTHTTYRQCLGSVRVDSYESGGASLAMFPTRLFSNSVWALGPTSNASFSLIASADIDGDGEIVEAELRAISVGLGENGYDVGPNTEITDLWQFLEHMSTLVPGDEDLGCERERSF